MRHPSQYASCTCSRAEHVPQEPRMGAQQRPIVSRRTHLLWLPQSPDAKHFNHQETLDPNTSSYDDKKRVLVRVSVGRNMMVASSKVYVRRESRGNGLQLTTRKRGFQKVGRVHGGVCTCLTLQRPTSLAQEYYFFLLLSIIARSCSGAAKLP